MGAPDTCPVPGCGHGLPCPWHPTSKPIPPRPKAPIPPPIVKSGRDLRDEALDQVEAAAEEVFMVEGRRILEDLAALGKDFTSDDLWERYDALGLERPHEPRALGALFMVARKAGLIVPTGEWWQSRARINHARDLRVWRGVR